METPSKINNNMYNLYGNRWYTATDDPVALLRAENKLKLPWIYERIISRRFKDPSILDIGCGAGFLCNGLADRGLKVTGVDNSYESLNVARLYDRTKSVEYIKTDAYSLPFANNSFDVITCLDFLEHVERPQDVIRECARVLKPQGQFYFHTFNRNFWSWLLVIKGVEYLVKNAQKNMHSLGMFIKPEELKEFCYKNGIAVREITGLRPNFSTIPLQNYFLRTVPESLEFQLTPSTTLSYMGMGTLDGKD